MDHIRLTTKIYRAVLLLSILSVTTCTDLQETHNGNLTAYQTANMSNVDALFSNLVNSMKEPFQNPFSGIIPLTEITTDELIAPTRGPDWDDNGIWRSLHQHRWDDSRLGSSSI